MSYKAYYFTYFSFLKLLIISNTNSDLKLVCVYTHVCICIYACAYMHLCMCVYKLTNSKTFMVMEKAKNILCVQKTISL